MVEPEFNEERAARESIESLLTAGRATELMEAYSLHGQSCQYIYGIIYDVATDQHGVFSADVRSFCQNLLDDWSK